MPSEVWGIKPDDRVEIRIMDKSAAKSPAWHLGKVLRITPDRHPLVLTDRGLSYEVADPRYIRLWKAPKTAADIDAFLNGG